MQVVERRGNLMGNIQPETRMEGGRRGVKGAENERPWNIKHPHTISWNCKLVINGREKMEGRWKEREHGNEKDTQG